MEKKNRRIARKKFFINKSNKIMRKRIRLNKRKKKKAKRVIIPSNVISNKNALLKFLESKKFSIRVTNKKNGAKIKIPKIFSFISNPNETIVTLKKIFYCLKNKNIRKINFDYSKCEEMGMCASLVLDLMVLEALKIRTNDLNLIGNYPATIEAKLVFCISGLVKHLNLSNLELENVKRLEIISNLESDEMSEKVIEYYEECLKTQGYELSEIGKVNFAKMVGEVIDNAEQYSGDFKSWHVVGHFNLQTEKKIGKCRLVLMNFGNSIYESLKDSSTTEYTKNLLNDHTKKTKGMFEFGLNEEVLWTLYALQQNVSKSRMSKDGDRGNGTIKLLKAFSEIGETIEGDKPKMTIISGNSYILLDGTYKLKEQTYDNTKVSIIAFNKENSLDILPDKRYVQILKNKFPGTIISLEFYLDRTYMNNLLRKD